MPTPLEDASELSSRRRHPAQRLPRRRAAVVAGCLAFSLAPLGCDAPPPTGIDDLIAAREALLRAAMLDALSQPCAGACPSSTTCDEASQTCVPAPCGGSCERGEHCPSGDPEGACEIDDRPARALASLFDRAFDETSFAGGDGLFSVARADGSRVWLLNDTWIADAELGRAAPDATIVHNAVALEEDDELTLYFVRGPDGPEPLVALEPGPRPDAIEGVDPSSTVLGDAIEGDPGAGDGTPDAGANSPGDNETGAEAPEPSANEGDAAEAPASADDRWLWWADGVEVDDGSIIVCAGLVERTDEGGTWGFRRAQSLIGTLTLPQDEAELPGVELFEAPHPELSDGETFLWGAEILIDPQAYDHLLIFGTLKSERRYAMLARVPIQELSEPASWTFFDGARFVPDIEALAPIAVDVPDEYSVDPPSDQDPTWTMIHADIELGPTVWVRRAHTAFGPYGLPLAAIELDVPMMGAFAYGARSHRALPAPIGTEVELDEPRGIVVSYVIGHPDLATVVESPSIYRPEFTWIPLADEEEPASSR